MITRRRSNIRSNRSKLYKIQQLSFGVGRLLGISAKATPCFIQDFLHNVPQVHSRTHKIELGDIFANYFFYYTYNATVFLSLLIYNHSGFLAATEVRSYACMENRESPTPTLTSRLSAVILKRGWVLDTCTSLSKAC